MSKIFKSSTIQIGAEKKLEFPKICHPVRPVEEKPRETVQDIQDIREIETRLKVVYEKKMKEAEALTAAKLQQAEMQAQQIISEAHEDEKRIYEEAKNKGYDEGYSAGYHDGKQEAGALIQEALEIKNELLRKKKELFSVIEKDCIELVIQTIEKILYQKIDASSEETILGLIRGALEKCAYTESLILRVSPEDYDQVCSIKDKILCLVENIDEIQIKQDASLQKGSCILDTVAGSIDSSIHTQFEQVKSIFEELLKNE
ncbi:MAG TPA: hypothetical protein GX503_03180 [Clostridiales bacterium]|nr:hypothetical protein [Clostridiales bacterium]